MSVRNVWHVGFTVTSIRERSHGQNSSSVLRMRQAERPTYTRIQKTGTARSDAPEGKALWK